MGLNIRIETNIKEFKVFMGALEEQVIKKSTKQALNKAIKSMRTETNRLIRERVKLKKGEINKRFLSLRQFKGGTKQPLDNFEASIKVSGDPISLIRFVRGQKEPIKQKGIAVNKRRRLRVQIRPGKTVRLKKAFIMKGRGGRNIVVRRKTVRTGPVAKQSAPALSVLVIKPKVKSAIERFGQKRLGIEYDRAFKFNLAKLRGPR